MEDPMLTQAKAETAQSPAETEAFGEGWECAQFGGRKNANPFKFVESPKLWNAWNNGYNRFKTFDAKCKRRDQFNQLKG